MLEVLMRAGSFVGIIFIGWLLRTLGFFKEEDFHVLSKIVLKITLPAAIISSFAEKEISPDMLAISLLGLGFGVLYMGAAYLLAAGKSREDQAFEVLNISGYNIGNFTMPFAQSFLGPVGIITTSLFDSGNAFICLGGSYSMAALLRNGQRFSLKALIKNLLHSVPFICYIIAVTFSLAHIPMPGLVVEFSGIIADANAFMAMLMLGVGFKLSGDRANLGTMVKILGLRYGIAAILAACCWFFLPLGLEYRQTLLILCFSPIASAAPAFTAQLKGDIGLSSSINSISILISLVCIVSLLTVTA